MNFKEFINTKSKSWKAKRQDVIDLWQKIRPYMPIQIQPVPQQHSGTRYRFDGIRITGTSGFINSVLSRLKDLLKYENSPGMKLDVEYQQIENKEGDLREARYVCYIHVTEKKNDLI
jgi:hypothetical protein